MSAAKRKTKQDMGRDLLRECSKTPADINIRRCMDLIMEGADVNVTDSDGNTPLIRAVMGRHNGIVGRLLEARNIALDSRNNKGETALIAAVKCLHEDSARMVMTAGAVCDIVDNRGKTARDYAALHGYFDLARMLDNGPEGRTRRAAEKEQRLRDIAQKVFRGLDHAAESAPIPPMIKKPFFPAIKSP